MDIGKVSVTPRGDWSDIYAYDPLDIVSHNGGSYLAKKSVTPGTVVTNTEYWLCLAQKGDTGVSISNITATKVNHTVTVVVTMSNSLTYTYSFDDGAEDSEAWAVGQRSGTDVPSTDPAYHNNAKYYKGLAETAESKIENMSASASVDSGTGTPSVVVTKTEGASGFNLDFDFSNLKGDQGEKGDKGDKGDAATMPVVVEGEKMIITAGASVSGEKLVIGA